MKKEKNDVLIFKSEEKNNVSKQVKKTENLSFDNCFISPEFSALEKLYEESFLVSWILDKVSNTIWKNISCKNEELQKILNKIDHKFLNESLELFWNVFFEVIREKHGKQKVIKLVPVITSTIKKLKSWWYLQAVWTEKVFFNKFIWDWDERKKQIEIWKNSWVGKYELTTEKWKKSWYNPNINEIFHFKRSSIVDKHYGKSLYLAPIDQILLLSQIDNFFTSLMDRWWMNNSIIFTEENEKSQPLSQAWQKILQDFLTRNFNWVKNSSTHAFIQKKLWKLDLSDNIDVNAFIEKTFELIKKISIAINIPYEILLTIMWNKSTSEQAEDNFIKQKIKPNQDIILTWFIELFEFDYDISELEYLEIETQNAMDKMKVNTWYVNAWILTPNEVREMLKYEKHIDWDKLQAKENKEEKTEENEESEEEKEEEIIKKTEENFFNFLKDIEKDVYRNL